MDALKARRVEGEGTPEAVWARWPLLRALPEVTVGELVPEGARAVILAPHPDDEILMAGGLMQALHAIGREMLIVAVTDGESSHPDSQLWSVEALRQARPRESLAAIAALAIGAPPCVRLHLPDAGVAANLATLERALGALLLPGDVLFCTWTKDGHPDHDACGTAAALAAAKTGARVIEVPVWTWHWSQPGDARVPWQRARRLRLDGPRLQRKIAAVAAFASQLENDATTGRGPVLRAAAVTRLTRPEEVFFV